VSNACYALIVISNVGDRCPMRCKRKV